MFILHYLMKWLYGEDYEKHMKRRRKQQIKAVIDTAFFI